MSSLRDFIKTTLIGGLLVGLPIGGLVMLVARAIVPVVFAALCLGTFTAHAQEESAQTTDSEDPAALPILAALLFPAALPIIVAGTTLGETRAAVSGRLLSMNARTYVRLWDANDRGHLRKARMGS